MPTVEINRRILYVTGLPRAGSTLLCQLLGHHPQVYSTGHSSPLAHALDSLRHSLSNDDFLLSQMDNDFDRAYQRLRHAYRGFINGWLAEAEQPAVVDKNRAWLGMIETVADLDPDFRMLVCVRDLGQVWGSMEAQHRRTILMDTGDRSAGLTPQGRAARVFNEGGLAAVPLGSIFALLNEVPAALRERVLFVRFDRLVSHTAHALDEIFGFCGLPPAAIDPQNLSVKPSESDSYYRFKFLHRTRSEVRPPALHEVPEPILAGLKNQYRWFYETFYPQLL